MRSNHDGRRGISRGSIRGSPLSFHSRDSATPDVAESLEWNLAVHPHGGLRNVDLSNVDLRQLSPRRARGYEPEATSAEVAAKRIAVAAPLVGRSLCLNVRCIEESCFLMKGS